MNPGLLPQVVDPSIAEFLREFGLPMLMLLATLVAFVRGWVVPGYVYKDALSQRDRALDNSEALVNAADVATTIAERVVRPKRAR